MSGFDPTQTAPACVPGQAGMRNQNIYTDAHHAGSRRRRARQFAAALGHDSAQLPGVRAEQQRRSRAATGLTIANQPVGGRRVVQTVRAARRRSTCRFRRDPRWRGRCSRDPPIRTRRCASASSRSSRRRRDRAERPAGHDRPQSGSDQSGYRQPGHREPGHRQSGYRQSRHRESGHRQPRHRERRGPQPRHRERQPRAIRTSRTRTSTTPTSRTRTSRT